MIVIPTIPEQQLTAASVEALGIGLRLTAGDLTEAVLRTAIHRVLDNQAWYAENLRVLLAGKPPLPAISLAHRLLDDYLQKELQPHLS
jgi:UDP:flavonoid glycosyltransferase YjiC (YdhE family)